MYCEIILNIRLKDNPKTVFIMHILSFSLLDLFVSLQYLIILYIKYMEIDQMVTASIDKTGTKISIIINRIENKGKYIFNVPF